ncbi:hypothetical protein L7F22_064386 [Adiantum nelumboides]|nr:hypothetical protein [Adiantum nelumboides]
MGPFGIAAVGLLANKGSRSRHKQSKPRDDKGSFRYSNGFLQVDDHRVEDVLTDAAFIGVCNQIPDLSMAERSIGTLVKPSSNPSECEGLDMLQAAKQNEVSKIRNTSVLKKESLKDGGKVIVSGLNHIKTRAPLDSVRTVDSALDTSESSSCISVEILGEGSPNNLRRQLKQEPGQNEHTPFKLRRSGKIRLGVSDTLLLNVQKLSIDGVVEGNECAHHEDTSNYIPAVENVGSTMRTSFKSGQLNMQEQLSFANSSIQSSNCGCVSSNSKSELTTAKGSAFDMTGSETTLSGTSVETIELYDKKETDSCLTCGLSTKKTSVDITSFSHQLSSTAVSSSNPYWHFQNLKNSEEDPTRADKALDELEEDQEPELEPEPEPELEPEPEPVPDASYGFYDFDFEDVEIQIAPSHEASTSKDR